MRKQLVNAQVDKGSGVKEWKFRSTIIKGQSNNEIISTPQFSLGYYDAFIKLFNGFFLQIEN